MNGTATYEWNNCIGRKSPKLRRRQIVQKNCLLRLCGLKDIATKSGETHVWDRALPSCIFHATPIIGARYLSPGKIYIFFLIGDSPWGLL